MELKAVQPGSLRRMCQYSAADRPTSEDITAFTGVLCNLSAAHPAMRVNWHSYCDGGENSTVTATEEWTGVLFIAKFIGLHIPRVLLTGPFPLELCRIPSLIYLNIAGNPVSGDCPCLIL